MSVSSMNWAKQKKVPSLQNSYGKLMKDSNFDFRRKTS